MRSEGCSETPGGVQSTLAKKKKKKWTHLFITNQNAALRQRW